MAAGTIFGLVLIAAGILVLAISGPLTKLSANSQAYLRPRLDKAAFIRRNLRVVRVMGFVWIVLGAGISVFGIVTGR